MPGLGLPAVFRRVLVLVVFVVILSVDSVGGQKNSADSASSPQYDTHTETKMTATVQELKPPAKGGETEVAHLFAKKGTDTIDIYLCPQSFLADMGISFAMGDEIVLTGSKVKQGEADLILAREVVKGTDTLVLRDAKGNPVWNWHR